MPIWCPECNAMLAEGTEECPRCGANLIHPNSDGGFSKSDGQAVTFQMTDLSNGSSVST